MVARHSIWKRRAFGARRLKKHTSETCKNRISFSQEGIGYQVSKVWNYTRACRTVPWLCPHQSAQLIDYLVVQGRCRSQFAVQKEAVCKCIRRQSCMDHRRESGKLDKYPPAQTLQMIRLMIQILSTLWGCTQCVLSLLEENMEKRSWEWDLYEAIRHLFLALKDRDRQFNPCYNLCKPPMQRRIGDVYLVRSWLQSMTGCGLQSIQTRDFLLKLGYTWQQFDV